ncbi:MAG: ParA family protein [Anaerolineales bacterium]|jgi:chromosome partitioning protein
MSVSKPYIMAVCHQKGGVGKTTTALALGACLAERGLHTLMVDLDPSGNLTNGVGLMQATAYKSIADYLLVSEPLQSILRQTTIPNLDIIPTNQDVSGLGSSLYSLAQYETLLYRRFSQSELDTYDFIIIDCPPSLGSLTILALGAAHLALIPVQCEYYAFQALEGLFKLIRSLRIKANPDLAYRLLISMYDRRGLLHTRVLERILEKMSKATFETRIGFDSKIRESQMAGVPLPVYAPNTRAALQFRALTDEILAYVQAQSIPQPA